MIEEGGTAQSDAVGALAEAPDVADEPCTLDGFLNQLCEELGTQPEIESQPEAPSQPEVDEPLLSDADVAMFGAMLEEGSNPEIRQILDLDRRTGGEWKRRAMRRHGAAKAVARTTAAGAAIHVEHKDSEAAIPAIPTTSADLRVRSDLAANEAIPTSTVPALPAGFPVVDADVLARAMKTVHPKSRDELWSALDAIAGAVHPHAVKRGDYARVRHWIWALNAVMTENDNAAPCVRTKASFGLVSPNAMTDEQRLILNDRQMFDLHFLHRTGMGQPNRKWMPLLRGEVFDPALAAVFIKTVGKFNTKVEVLGLREDEQMLLGAIRSGSVRKRWERLEREAERLVNHIRADIAKGKSRITEADTPRWREEFIALVLAEGSPGHAAKLLPRLYGRGRDAAQLANRKLYLARKGFPPG